MTGPIPGGIPPTPTAMQDLQGFTDAQLQEKLSRGHTLLNKDPSQQWVVRAIADINHVMNQREDMARRGTDPSLGAVDKSMQPDVDVMDTKRIKGNLPAMGGLAAGVGAGALGAAYAPQLTSLATSLAAKTFPKVAKGIEAWKTGRPGGMAPDYLNPEQYTPPEGTPPITPKASPTSATDPSSFSPEPPLQIENSGKSLNPQKFTPEPAGTPPGPQAAEPEPEADEPNPFKDAMDKIAKMRKMK